MSAGTIFSSAVKAIPNGTGYMSPGSTTVNGDGLALGVGGVCSSLIGMDR